MYQGRSFYAPANQSVAKLPQTFFGWVWPTCWTSISDYIEISGLDAYFLLRYLRVLTVLCLGLSVMNDTILVPINFYAGQSNGNATGLDMLSWANVAPSKWYLFNWHFTLAIVTIVTIHWVIFHELNTFIHIRQYYLMHNSAVNSVVMIDNVSEGYKQIHFGNNLMKHSLLQSLNCLPGKIKNVWFIYHFSEIKRLAERNKRYLKQIEELETRILIDNWKFCRKQELLKQEVIQDEANGMEPTIFQLDSTESTRRQYQEYLTELDKQTVRPSRLKAFFKCGSISLKFPSMSNRVDQVDSLIEKYLKNKELLVQTRARLLDDRTPCYHKMFVQFNRKVSSYITKQILLSSSPSENSFKVIEINPKDIIWDNIHLNNFWLKKFRYFISNVLKVLLVITWAIPTSFIGLMSQIQPNTFKFLGWLDNLPDVGKNLFSSVFPSIGLILITELIPIVFRWLSLLKGKITHAEVELDIQNWCFGFFFIHVFFIVTVSSSATAVIESFLINLGSIPTLLARNIPKASNFFFCFLVLRGLTYCGGNLLRSFKLFNTFLINKVLRKKKSPREKLKQLTKLDHIEWGSVYPMYTILATICIIFSIVAPLVTLFGALSFSLILLSYKYTLKFCYSAESPSETFGRFYPMALKQLHYGVYCLELCLVGLFFLVRNEREEVVCVKQGIVIMVMFFASVSMHMYISHTYHSALKYLPLEFLDEEKKHETEAEESASVINCFNENNYDITFSHPSLEYDESADYIWLPEDKYGNHLREIMYLKERGIRATSTNCILNDNGEIFMKGYPDKYA